MSMKLVVPTELYENESRVSITPDIIPSLKKMGFNSYSSKLYWNRFSEREVKTIKKHMSYFGFNKRT